MRDQLGCIVPHDLVELPSPTVLNYEQFQRVLACTWYEVTRPDTLRNTEGWVPEGHMETMVMASAYAMGLPAPGLGQWVHKTTQLLTSQNAGSGIRGFYNDKGDKDG